MQKDGAARLVPKLAPVLFVGASVFLLRKQLPEAARAFVHARALALLCIPLFFAWNQLATLSWRSLLRASGATALGVGSLFRARLESQAVNQIVPSAGLAGEGVRAARAANPGELAASSFATLLDNVAGTMSGLVFSLGALGAHLLTRRAGAHEVRTLTIASAAALAALVVLVVMPFQLGHRLVPLLREESRVRRILTPFADRRISIRRAFADAVALRFLERILCGVEVYVFFAALGTPVGVADAALVSATFIVVSFTVFFLPGQLGAAEAGAAVVSSLIGVPPALGLSVALLRRARQLGVCAMGLVSILLRRERWAFRAPTVEKTP